MVENLMDCFKLLKAGKVVDPVPSMLHPLLRWCSGSPKDLEWCATTNRYTWHVDKNIATGLLAIGLQDHNPFQKYPKATKQPDDKKMQLQQELACQYFGWSKSEYAKNLSVVQYIDWQVIARALGCDKKACKLLGVPEPKFVKRSAPPAKKAPSLFDF